MAIDFPNSPTVGQTYTYSGVTYKFTAEGNWVVVGPNYTPIIVGAPTSGQIARWTNPTSIEGVSPATAALSGSRILITSQTISTPVASVDFTTGIDGTYDQYELDFYGVKPSADQAVFMQISQDGGATWKTDASYQIGGYYVGSIGAPAWAQTTVQSAMTLVVGSVSAVGNGAANGLVKFSKPNINEFHMVMIDSVSHSSGSSFMRYGSCCGYAGNSLAFNALRITPISTNLAQGTFNLYGIKK